MERAQQAWPEVLERKVAVMEHAVQQQLPATLLEVEREDRAATLHDHFQSHLAEEWGKVTTGHRVTGAAMPALDRDLLVRHGLAELLHTAEPMPEVAPVTATSEAEPEARIARDEFQVDADDSAGIQGAAEPEPTPDQDDVGTVEGRVEVTAAVSQRERQATHVHEPELQLEETVQDLEDRRAVTPQIEPERADIGRAEAEREAELLEEEAAEAPRPPPATWRRAD